MKRKRPLVTLIIAVFGFATSLGGDYLKTETALGTAQTQLQIETLKDKANQDSAICTTTYQLAGDETPSPLLNEAQRHEIGEIIVRNMESCHPSNNPAVRALPPPVAQPPKEPR